VVTEAQRKYKPTMCEEGSLETLQTEEISHSLTMRHGWGQCEPNYDVPYSEADNEKEVE